MRITQTLDVWGFLRLMFDNILGWAADVAHPATPVHALILACLIALLLALVVEHLAPRFAPDDDPFRYTESE